MKAKHLIASIIAATCFALLLVNIRSGAEGAGLNRDRALLSQIGRFTIVVDPPVHDPKIYARDSSGVIHEIGSGTLEWIETSTGRDVFNDEPTFVVRRGSDKGFVVTALPDKTT